MTHQPPFRELLLRDDPDQPSLDPTLRQLCILRVLHRLHAHQACLQRVADARRAGVSDEQLVAIQHPGTGPFSPKQRLGLAFVDAVVHAPAAPDGLVEPLRSAFSEREIRELVLLANSYGQSGQQQAV